MMGCAAICWCKRSFIRFAAPPLLSCGPRLQVPDDLAQHVLLHEEWNLLDQLDWADWLAAIGADGIDPQRGLRFSFSHMTLQVAAAGQGVALASSAFIADDLTTGRLVRPFGKLSVLGPHGFYIVCPNATADREKTAAFRDWALEEAADEP